MREDRRYASGESWAPTGSPLAAVDQHQHVRPLLRRRAEPVHGGLLPAGPLIIGDSNTPAQLEQ